MTTKEMIDGWNKATAYLEKDRKAHIAAHGSWHLDSGKLEAAFLGTVQGEAGAAVEALRDLLDLIENEIGYSTTADDPQTRDYARRVIEARSILARIDQGGQPTK